jgi:hypothetical protein
VLTGDPPAADSTPGPVSAGPPPGSHTGDPPRAGNPVSPAGPGAHTESAAAGVFSTSADVTDTRRARPGHAATAANNPDFQSGQKIEQAAQGHALSTSAAQPGQTVQSPSLQGQAFQVQTQGQPVHGPSQSPSLQSMAPEQTIQGLPQSVLSRILIDVVLDAGNVSYGVLSQVCKTWRELVSSRDFKRQHHLKWLDSKYRIVSTLSRQILAGWCLYWNSDV